MLLSRTHSNRPRLRRRALALVAATALVGGLAASTALAATPASGTVNPTAPVLQYTASFTTPDTCDPEGKATCGDEFALTVDTPAGYGDGHALTVQVDWPNMAADFDVYLLTKDRSKVIASAASTSDPEQLFAAADSGEYVVRIVAFLPLPFGGQIVTSTVRLVDRASAPTSSLPTPAYRNYPAPEGLRSVHDAGEPSLGVNYRTGSVMYQAGLSAYRVQFDDTKSPAGATFLDKSARPPKCTQATSLDPYLFTDNTLGRTFSSQLTGVSSLTCFTDDDGDNWKPSTGGGIPSGVDHQSLGAGPFSPNGLGPTTAYPHAVYYCSQDIATAFCALSRDGGVTFGQGNMIYNLKDCSGLHGHVKVAPDGTVYVPNKNCNGKAAVSVSRDNGLTWTVRRVPTSLGRQGGSDPSVGIGSNGTVYMGYQNRDLSNPPQFATARIAVSHDQGETWIRDYDVGSQLGIKNIVFPAVIAGDDNRAAYAFLGTTTPGDYQDNTDTPDSPSFKGVWHLYVATTTDGGQSWKTVDLTPNDPVQRGSICTGGTSCGEDRNLLDFMDADVDAQGRVVVGYADGCTGPCVTGEPETDANTASFHDAYATIARQYGGARLFAQFDAKPDLIVRSLRAYKDAAGIHVSGLVTNIGKETATNVLLQFREGCCPAYQGNTSPAITLAPGQSKRIGVLDARQLRGAHSYLAVVDPGNLVAESDETNNKISKSFTFS